MYDGGPQHGWWCNAHTYPTHCKYCGEPVFFFTCDCGSKVFFDALGPPWPEHRCAQYLMARYGKTRLGPLAAQMALPGISSLGFQIDSKYAAVIRERYERPRPPEHHIVRCSPKAGQTVRGTGTVREIIPHVDVFKHLSIPMNSIFGVRLLGPLGREAFGQVTIYMGDLAEEDVKSYTCFVSQRLLTNGLERGDVVSFHLEAFSIPGRPASWLCKGLEHPFS